MKKFYFAVAVLALLAASCVKEMDKGGNGVPEKAGDIPADFDWKMTRDMTTTVAAPEVNGQMPEYAVVRIYSSPILTPENIVAKGVTRPSAAFRTAFTVPTGVRNVYVQTALPDGMKSVKMVPVQASADIAGAEFKTLSAPKIRIAQQTLRESAMPEFPVMEAKAEADFDPAAVIRETPGYKYDLGADYMKWQTGAAVAPEYYIPAGSQITGNIDLSGGQSPYPAPILYVAGKLIVPSLGIGQARLAVLPGGEVTVKSLAGNGSGDISKPSIYVFEGGRFNIDDKPNLGSRTIVNCGEFFVDDDVDLNNNLTFYNAATAEFRADELKCSNNVKFYSDGKCLLEELKLNSNAEFHNYENGKLEIEDECEFERNTRIYQRGIAEICEMTARGTIWVNCYTVVKEIDGEGAEFNFASGVALDAGKVEFNNTTVSMASGSAFVIGEYNADEKGGGNYFKALSGADPRAVVSIIGKAYTRKGHETYFSGPMEVVYDNSADPDYTIKKEYLTDDAVLVAEQTVVIADGICNGGKVPVNPGEEPEPSEEYNTVKGAPYTYCFEDNWPWFGDYDMNDIVVLTSIDRSVSKDGSKVASLTINWELKAAGKAFDDAFGVQLDKVLSSQIASVESSHTGFKSGIFAAEGLEAGQKYAVIPFFNKTGELLASSNVWPGQYSPTTKHTTKIVFTQPVPAEDVLETAMNYFIVVNSRAAEIHMPTYRPTDKGEIMSGYNLSDDPYKFYSQTGDRAADNYMMWGLMVPGDFRYPAESKDIRGVYTYFLTWASSNGTQHQEWYLEEADQSKLY